MSDAVTPGEVAYNAFREMRNLPYEPDYLWHHQTEQTQAEWEAAAKAVLAHAAEETPCPDGTSAWQANVSAALTAQSERLDKLVAGVNTIGVQFNQILSTVGGIAGELSKSGPLGLLKLMGKNKGGVSGDAGGE